MIKRFCDWCGEQIADADLMPVGGGEQRQPIRLGMEVRNGMPGESEEDDPRVITVVVGPVSVDGRGNAHDFHKACVQAVVTTGTVQ